jgi:excinuclease ABC subunit C
VTAKAGRSIPCLDYYIGLCPAPCTLEPAKLAEHEDNLAKLRDFMRGGAARNRTMEEVSARMRAFAERRQYEEAAKLRDEIRTLERLSERQVVRDAVAEDADIVVLLPKYDRLFAGIAEVRDSELVSVRRMTVENPADLPVEEALSGILAERYVDHERDKRLLLLREPISDASVNEFLKSRRINPEVPALGPKKDLVDFVYANVMNFAYREAMDSLREATLSRETMASILRALGYEPPKSGQIIFECNDISHTSGRFTVASRSVVTNGRPDSARYRKYKIKSIADGMIDDFASMREVLYRRTLEGIDTGNFPTMILIDGGKGQLSHALEGIEAAISDRGVDRSALALPYMASLAKREEEVFVPGESESHRFERGSAELSLLQKVRDEAHRFAINFGRSKRDKALKKNILEELPGFGPATRKKLLSAIGSVDRLQDTPVEILSGLLSNPQLQTLRDHGMLSGE